VTLKNKRQFQAETSFEIFSLRFGHSKGISRSPLSIFEQKWNKENQMLLKASICKYGFAL